MSPPVACTQRWWGSIIGCSCLFRCDPGAAIPGRGGRDTMLAGGRNPEIDTRGLGRRVLGGCRGEPCAGCDRRQRAHRCRSSPQGGSCNHTRPAWPGSRTAAGRHRSRPGRRRCAAPVRGSGMSSASGRGAARCSISPRNAVPCSAPSQPSKLIRHRSDRGCAAHRPRNRDPQGQQALVRRDRAPVSQHGSYEPVPRTAYRVEQFLRAQCGNRLAQCVDAAQRRLHTVVGGRSHASILSLYPDKEGPARPQRKKDDTNGQIHRLTVPAPLVIRRKLADTAARRWRW